MSANRAPAKVNIAQKLSRFDEVYSPKVVAELNGQYVKVVKCLGEYVWHSHESEDEMFLVIKGSLRIELRDGSVTLGPGEFLVVPRGIEHRPVADELCEIVVFEPATVRNTGEVDHGYTIEPEDLERI
jgi:mannose-6-phosphate isomerase-like protein (cupin superfamily)